jgi:hypothetical protein
MKEQVFDNINPARREFLKKLLVGAAFATPVIATFSVESLTASPINISSPNAICIPPPVQPASVPISPACSVDTCVPQPTPIPDAPITPACGASIVSTS